MKLDINKIPLTISTIIIFFTPVLNIWFIVWLIETIRKEKKQNQSTEEFWLPIIKYTGK